MKVLALVATLTATLFAWSFGSFAYIAGGPTQSEAIYAQEDCKDGETWNEETQKCDKAEGGN